jgi:hypothetical protein
MLKVLSKREKVILYSTIGVILFAVIFNVLLYPLMDRNTRLNKEIELTRQKLKKYLWLLSQKDIIENKYSKFSQALKAPAQEDPLVAGLAQLENMAKEANIRIIDMRPEAQPKAQGPYKEAMIELRAEGGAEGFLKFIYEIENSLSLLKIKKFQLSSRANAQVLEARFTVSQLFTPE